MIAPLLGKLKYYSFGSKLYNKLIISYPQLSQMMFNCHVGSNGTIMNTPEQLMNGSSISNTYCNQNMYYKQNENGSSISSQSNHGPSYKKREANSRNQMTQNYKDGDNYQQNEKSCYTKNKGH